MDRRLTPANDRAALASLRGVADAPRFVTGEAARSAVPLTDLLRAPDGARDRQLLLGDAVTVIDRHRGWAFVQAAKDGYCGYLPENALGLPAPPTHWVTVPATHLYPEPRVQSKETASLSFGCRLCVTAESGRFAQTPDGFVPLVHLSPIGWHFADPVDVAGLFLGTPYLWGGNSRAGMDCSGLVQAALLACGLSCPGDSDLQQVLGTDVPTGTALRRGDLVFWKGHVAMVADDDRMIHANGHAMATVHEGIDATLARIAALGTPMLARRRL